MDLVNILKSQDCSRIFDELDSFNQKNAKSFTFEALNTCNIQKEVWNSIVSLLRDPAYSRCHSPCLLALKILSRDKQFLDDIITKDVIEVLLEKANLSLKDEAALPLDYEGILEAQKCIFNLVFSHEKSRNLVIEDSRAAEAILLRISADDATTCNPHEVLLFDLKILFLLTALCSSCRPSLRYSLKGIQRLTKLLDQCVAQGIDQLTDNSVALCCESLKVIFNVLLSTERLPSAEEDEDPEDQLNLQRHLVDIVRLFLLVKSNALEKREELKIQAVNLLTNISPECFVQLAPVNPDTDGRDMSTFLILLQFLEDRLDKPARVLLEEIMPILTVLIECARKESTIRKFLRSRVLPPLKDVSRRPEEGGEIRNKLCRLMTSAATQVEYLVAEFLFILCKENVGRLIKYTGYGNAAGLLANRGLMMGRPADHVSSFSSDSEDSDTEEYKRAEKSINPVTGSVELPRPNPLENMTEEQKEYEAVKLVNMIDQLQRKGIIQPAKVGEDGKPHPIEHVLELQKD